MCTVWHPINQVMLLHGRASSLTLPIVPSPCGASARDPSNIGNTGGASVKPTTIFVETDVPTRDPLGATTYTTLRSGQDKYARKHTPRSVSDLRKNIVSNFHSRKWALSISFIDRVAQIPHGLAYHAANAPSVMKRYCVSGYNSLVHSITTAKSAMVLALINWNIYMNQIAASEGWDDPPPQPVHTPSNIESIPETDLLPGRQTELALRKEESLCVYAGSTAQRTTLLLGRMALREVRKWEIAGKTTAWVARIRWRAWDDLVIVAVVPMALLAVLVLLGLAWVLKWWWRAAVWLW